MNISLNKNVLILIYFFFQLIFILFFANGSTGDEGIYITAGLKLLDNGKDTFSSWHNGSPYLWSVVIGFVYKYSSFFGVRLFALFINLLSIHVLIKISGYFLDQKDTHWALLGLLLFGPFQWLSHLGVYDVLGMFFFLLAQLLVLSATRSYPKLLLAGVIAALSILSKYAFVMVVPVIILSLLFKKERSFISLLSFVFPIILIVSVHNFILFDSLIPTSYSAYQEMKQSQNSLSTLGLMLFYFYPIALSIYYLIGNQKTDFDKSQVIVWLAALSIFPLFHVLTGNPQSAGKHMVASCAYAAPLIGLGLKKLLAQRKIWLYAILAWVIIQLIIHEYSYLNITGVTNYLVENVDSKTKIASNMGTYKYKFEIYDVLEDIDTQIIRVKDNMPNNSEAILESDIILWTEFPNKYPEEWGEQLLANYYIDHQYQSYFIGASEGLPFGLHSLKTMIYRKNKAKSNDN